MKKKIIIDNQGEQWLYCKCGMILPANCDIGKDYCQRCNHNCKSEIKLIRKGGL